MSSSYQVKNATCTVCGCVCDDIELTVERGQISAARNACVLGAPWFLERCAAERPFGVVAGQPTTTDAAVQAAAQILAAARFPLVYGLSEMTSEGQRQAVALADLLGASIDTPSAAHDGPAGTAFLGVGAVTATLGEIKNRADLVIYWGCDPAATHPRHATRYAREARGMFIPDGAQGRSVVVIATQPTPSAADADLFVQIAPGKDFELLWALRALVKGVALDASIADETGVPLATLTALVARMKTCTFGVICYGAGLTEDAARFAAGALMALTTDLNAHTKFVASPLRGRGNAAGAENVLTWQTGYPFGVNLSRGYPRFNPGEWTAAELLARGEADAALIVGCDAAAHLPPRAVERLAHIPTVALAPHECATTRIARVAITTATYGINTAGTVYRMDGVPIRLRKALDAPYPSDEDVLGRIIAAVKTMRA